MNDVTLVLKSDWFALYAATGIPGWAISARRRGSARLEDKAARYWLAVAALKGRR